MLTALIILALLSLLVATEVDPASTPADHAPDQPMRPTGRSAAAQNPEKPGRLAA